MCDTLVALQNATKDNSVLFGKNSDRPQDEVQLITYNPRFKYSKEEKVQCTYISIPQTSETFAVLLSQPFWMWGAEMGANEYGVVIGNEAVYTKEQIRSIGLLGMDLLRLGLERGKSALEALEVITNLLETYGQGGGCAYNDNSWMYHNSFIIGDSKEAYVLETADKWWIAEYIKSTRSISNSISIRGKGDFRSKGIIEHAIEKNYCKDDENFDFAPMFSDYYVSENLSPYSRACKSKFLLEENTGEISAKLMMEILREHEVGICMHGGFESTGSQVSSLQKDVNCSIHWFTGSTLPCLSIYKPYIFPVDGQKFQKPGPYSRINYEWFWNQHTRYINPFKGYSLGVEKERYISKLRSIENEILKQTNRNSIENCNLDNQKFLNTIKELNMETWNKAKSILN